MAKKTYQRVVDLINEHIPEKISRNEFCRITGVNRNSVDRYRAGIGCPTDETLHKLAAYFKKSVPWLRGEVNNADRGVIRGGEFVVESIAQFLSHEESQVVVRGKIIEAMKSKGAWGKSGAYAALAEALGYPEDYTEQVISGNKPISEEFFLRIAECLEVDISWLKGEIPFSFEVENKRYRETKPTRDRALAGLDAVGRFSRGLAEGEDFEEKLKSYDQEFPQVYAAMAEVPKERQQEVADYVFVRASRDPGFVKSQQDDE